MQTKPPFLSLKISLPLIERENISLKGKISPEIFFFPEYDLIKKVEKIETQLLAGKINQEILVQAKIKSTFQCICPRDLNTFLKTIEIPQIKFTLPIPNSEEIDLSEAFREEILLNIPHLTCEQADTPQKCGEIPEKYLALDKSNENCIGKYFET